MVWNEVSTLTAVASRPDVRAVPHDVTECDRALRGLRGSEEQFRSIVENASDIIGIIDPDGTIRYQNPAGERSLGYARHEVIGKAFLGFVHPEERARAAEFLAARSCDSDAAGTLEVRLCHHDGTWRSFEVVARCLARGDRAKGTIISARDITRRRALEAQLAQAQRLTSLGHLAATVAHEFNNVLMGMQPFAEILQRPGLTSDSGAKCGFHIANSVQRGKRVALDILRFTQPARPSIVPIDVAQWWKRLLPEVRAIVGNHIAVIDDIPRELTIAGDPAQLSQMMMNLIANARDAMPSGGSLTVRACELEQGVDSHHFTVPDGERYVRLSMIDTGCGIEKDVLPHVFDPLFTTRQNGGTGLGLAVVRQVITRHGGKVFVDSEVGRGTRFHIYLPRAEASGTPASASVHPRSPGELSCAILLVDDEELILQGLSELLEEAGASVAVASNGAEARRALAERTPEVIILDIGLPDVDGVQLGHEIRASLPTVPLIFATGHADKRRLEAMLADGITAFLQKPFEIGTLIEVIGQLTSTAEEPRS